MDIAKVLKTIGEQISTFASGKLAFAEPVSVADRTVIPVAWVRYDFGAGGSTPAPYRRMAQEAGGGGGGGQVSVIPAGIIEITPTRTRFIPIPDGKKIFALIASSSANSGMNNGGSPAKENHPLGASDTPSKQLATAYGSAANKKAAGKRSMPAQKKARVKKVQAKKAVPVKTSRSLPRKVASASTFAKKVARKKSAGRQR
ncbi:hypothetical protein ACPOL_0389 [Acidisarcina polymorpha]|uniref:Uncharacterized protein n=1 Tax=Acidisarcina polymorpha TaxID=2211140 RepID=A0A2Z5FSF3_9BACT|nr:spore germination protein GerW family protein [Acidisarcina polymorpha]AXC09768.1 hypothetical protein ACPOL_0389 [Acidisarcina polymorpha]